MDVWYRGKVVPDVRRKPLSYDIIQREEKRIAGKKRMSDARTMRTGNIEGVSLTTKENMIVQVSPTTGTPKKTQWRRCVLLVLV
jgi:hypothetical protein